MAAPSAAAPAAAESPRLGVGGYWKLFKDGYEELVKAIIRPPSAEYRLRELGPESFAFGGVDFVREDSQLTNARGLRLECSMWHRARLPEGGAPCVVYLHGNASCRAEALQVISAVLATGASLFAFDFAGCGQSEGEYISLGWHEQDDVQLALEHLRASGIVTSMALWGRSMGACAAVMHASRDPGVAGIVADSPFASLEQVAMELVQHAPNVVDGAPTVPPFLVRAALRIVAGTVKGRAAFDLYKLRPVDRARTGFTPALFATAHDDVLIRPHHTTSIYEEYAGDKNHVSFEGDHNELRPAFFLDSAAIFLTETLRIPDSLALQQTADPVTGRPMNLLDSWARAARGVFGGGSRGALSDYDSFGGGGGGARRRGSSRRRLAWRRWRRRCCAPRSPPRSPTARPRPRTATAQPRRSRSTRRRCRRRPRRAAQRPRAAPPSCAICSTAPAPTARRARPTANGDAAAAPTWSSRPSRSPRRPRRSRSRRPLRIGRRMRSWRACDQLSLQESST